MFDSLRTFLCLMVVGSALYAAQSLNADDSVRQQRDLEQISQTYRIRVYNRFRTDRSRYDMWISAAEQVRQNSKAIDLSVDWYRQALDAVGSGAATPPVTFFDSPTVVHSNEPIALPPSPATSPGRMEPNVTVVRDVPEATKIPHHPDVHVPAPAQRPAEVVQTPVAEPPVQLPPKPVESTPAPAPKPVPVTTPPIVRTRRATANPDQTVDVGVLSARIRSINLALGRIEDTLVENRLLTIDELRLLVAQMDEYYSQLDLTTIYVSILSEQQLRRVARLRSAEFVLKDLEQAIANQRAWVAESASLDRTQDSEINELDTLLRRVQSWQQTNVKTN
ncbi:MAG: hypothetical protein KDA87_06145 [Planctomycetales bacterium]|nr:hypothetical protein [Planctomycetales bacterium]